MRWPDIEHADVHRDISLAPFSTLGVGGPARWFVRAETPMHVALADAWVEEHHAPMFVLGGGSNVVIADAGFDGFVLQIGMTGRTITQQGDQTFIRAAAGESWDAVVADAVTRELCGIESLSGIPGSVGGTPIQNVGAYGQEVATTITRVTAFDRQRHEMVTLTNDECEFGYRTSRFKTRDLGRFIVCAVTFALTRGVAAPTYPDVRRYLDECRITAPTVDDVRTAVLAIRRRKGMVLDANDTDSRSVGSFFMNPVVTRDTHDRVSSLSGAEAPAYAVDDGQVKLAAAWLIERAGLHKGFVDGRVGISTKHPLAIVNRGGATARDVLRLAVRIKRQVADRFGVLLRTEPIFIGFDDDSDVKYLRDS